MQSYPQQNFAQNKKYDDAEEPEKPSIGGNKEGKKERGFRARLNQHIDEGTSKTDAEI